MDENKWERFGAGAGVVFVILLVVGAFVAPQPPHIDASVAKISTYYADHRRALLTGQLLGTLGVVAFLWFVGHLRHVLQRAEGGVEALSPIVYAAGAATAALGALSALPSTTLAFAANNQELTANAAVVRMLFDLNVIAGNVLGIVAGLFIASASLAMVRKEMVAAGLGWAGLVVALAMWVSAAAGFYVTTYNGFWAGLGLVSFLAFLAWTLLTSLSMLQRPEAARATARGPVFAQ